MNKAIKENLSKIITIFLIMQPVIDMLTGLSLHLLNLNLTIGIIVRLLFLLFLIYTTTFIYHKKKSFLFYIFFLIYCSFYIIGLFLFKENLHLFSELQGLFRTFYFPLVLISLYDLKDEIRLSKMTLFFSLTLYLLFIFLPVIFNAGFKSYEITKAGTLGFFNSANEISGIISILTPIMLFIFSKKKNHFLNLIYLLIYFFVILTIGTKTPLLSLLITVMMIVIWVLVKIIKSKRYSLLFSTLLVIILGASSLIIIVPKTNFYKNIITHLNYLKIKDISDITENKEVIDHFIFSERISFYGERKERYNSSSPYEKLFGIGYLNDDKLAKAVEMDYYDIYFNHGLCGFLIFFCPYLYVLFIIAKEKTKKDFSSYMLTTSLLLVIILSFFTGHIITSPAVSIFAASLIIMSSPKSKKHLLFAINELNIGGIEMALVNLLNNINYDKYKVTVIMEKKKGLLLNSLNKNVKVEELKVASCKNVLIRKSLNFFRKFNYEVTSFASYDFSCCYATYSFSSAKIALIASKNSALYVHSDYTHIYKEESSFKAFFDTRNITKFRKIIFVSNESKSAFLKFYPTLEEKCLVINNFVDTNKIIKLSQEKIKETKPKDKKLFVFIGRLDDKSKKVGRIINLVKNIKDIAVIIVGDGPDRKNYEQLVKDNNLTDRINFVLEKSNPYPYLKLADYIILTSDYEGFPVIYQEALTLEKPLITTIDVSDDSLSIKDYASIVSKDETKMLKEVKDILKHPPKMKKANIAENQKMRTYLLEKVFDEVI